MGIYETQKDALLQLIAKRNAEPSRLTESTIDDDAEEDPPQDNTPYSNPESLSLQRFGYKLPMDKNGEIELTFWMEEVTIEAKDAMEWYSEHLTEDVEEKQRLDGAFAAMELHFGKRKLIALEESRGRTGV